MMPVLLKKLVIDRFTDYRSKIFRLYLSKKYLCGNGLEIGALHNPLKVFNGAHVSYVDHKNVRDLRSDFPELRDRCLVDVDIIDDGEHLYTIRDNSVDFVIASHFLEHCEDPIATIKTFIRVLRPGGVLFLAVPDKRYTFDKERGLTTLEHLIRDHRTGPLVSRGDHFREFEEFAAHEPVKSDYSIHYHVWTDKEVAQLLSYMETEMGLRISTIASVHLGFENIFLAKKR